MENINYLKIFGSCLLILAWMLIDSHQIFSQADRWQQRVDYQMEIDFDVNLHRFTGKQRLVYFNNSPDELTKVFYHLYFNAFQPGSMMDVRSRNIKDPDGRVEGRIQSLGDSEIGYHKITSLKQNGVPVDYQVEGTILEVTLAAAIAPNSQTLLELEFHSQVPVQIRRSGRNNREGIDYSMAQWYPKLCEYDYQGWHANPYIGREFYGVWGNFDVKIKIDAEQVVAATGYLQNASQVGHGYADGEVNQEIVDGKLMWHFFAPNVHDFVWAADPEYTHTKKIAADGTAMHFFFVKDEFTEEPWGTLPDVMSYVFEYNAKHFGKYPYKKYSFIQGGDGGMEYPMATLITGKRNLSGLVGVSVHELFHSWYQMILGTNESLYAWMDEGFTSYASSEVMNELRKQKLIPGTVRNDPHRGSNFGYIRFASTGAEEPLSTHADHFLSNQAYGVGAYVKGAVFLNQLKYIIGKEAFDQGMLDYFNTWKFKHPNANDFVRIMEKVSGLELDWYKEYMVNTTHTIDYAVQGIEANGNKTNISLEKIGVMPMPIDLVVTQKNGTTRYYYIPLRIMRGEKNDSIYEVKAQLRPDWPWTHPNYQLEIDIPLEEITKIEIDPSKRMADADIQNNTWPSEQE